MAYFWSSWMERLLKVSYKAWCTKTSISSGFYARSRIAESSGIIRCLQNVMFSDGLIFTNWWVWSGISLGWIFICNCFIASETDHFHILRPLHNISCYVSVYLLSIFPVSFWEELGIYSRYKSWSGTCGANIFFHFLDFLLYGSFWWTKTLILLSNITVFPL